jgi:outer membrane lipoprotein SlyB
VTFAASSATKRRQKKEHGGLIYRFLIPVLLVAGLSACGPSYSPDTYASNAAQQANKVEQGVVVGVRTVGVSAVGTVGTLSGAAAGGIAGSQVGAGPVSALSALGGGLVGGIAGSTVEHVTSDTTAYEYIVRKPNGDLVSVTQKDKTPLALGQKVLVIAGTQARVVPDYTVPVAAMPVKPGEVPKGEAAAAAVKPADAKPGEAPATEGAPPAAPPAARASPTGAQPAPIVLQGAQPAAATP